MRPGFVVILEGVDKTGKTSTARDLHDILGWPIIKHSQPKPGVDPYVEYNATLGAHQESFIADRFHLGEAVYGPIYRGTPKPSSPVNIAFEQRLMNRGALLILMVDKAEAIIERWRTLKEDFAQEDKVRLMLRSYEDEYAESFLSKLRLTYTGDSLALANIIRNMEAATR